MRSPSLFLCFLLAAVLPASAQKPPVDNGADTGEATTNDEGPGGIVPYTRGYNVSLGTTSQHDSSNGWSSILTPNLHPEPLLHTPQNPHTMRQST